MAQIPATNSPNYHCVQGLTRGLELLTELNRRRGAMAQVVELSANTGLNRSTVKRLLETLRLAGFVYLMDDGRTYTLTSQVQQLSKGFRGESLVCSTAIPFLQTLTKTILWPAALVMCEGDEMVVRYSTNAQSPLSFHPARVVEHNPILCTASGRAYLAFCPDEEREHLLNMVSRKGGEESRLLRDTRRLSALLSSTRERGLAVNDGECPLQPAFGALAAPVLHASHVVACVRLVFSRRAISATDASNRYGALIAGVARNVERALEASLQAKFNI